MRRDRGRMLHLELEGAIVMGMAGYTRVRLACPKPATREQCEALLGKISEAR
jgi:hypothetical protein